MRYDFENTVEIEKHNTCDITLISHKAFPTGVSREPKAFKMEPKISAVEPSWRQRHQKSAPEGDHQSKKNDVEKVGSRTPGLTRGTRPEAPSSKIYDEIAKLGANLMPKLIKHQCQNRYRNKS